MDFNLNRCYPKDAKGALLLGRIWKGGETGGPCTVVIENEMVYDITSTYPIMAELLNQPNVLKCIQSASKERISDVFTLLENSDPKLKKSNFPYLLPPCDLQAIKACGVTFATSILERLVEEQAKGDPEQADAYRASLEKDLGIDLNQLQPGSPEAEKAKQRLIEKGIWSQYLEVAIGPDAEIFTKAPPMSAIGIGDTLGIRDDSSWSNPEPEVVLAINASGKIVGAALGNDVNLRDFEGRSALLLGKAKDNNAACVIGPFIRIFNDSFSLEDIRQAEVFLSVEGEDGFSMSGRSRMNLISRDIEDLTAQVIGKHHQYPDGLMLFTGTLFAPTQDRDTSGKGFTHKLGDIVSISSPKLGALLNRVGYCHQVPPWTFGITAFMHNLSQRGLLKTSCPPSN